MCVCVCVFAFVSLLFHCQSAILASINHTGYVICIALDTEKHTQTHTHTLATNCISTNRPLALSANDHHWPVLLLLLSGEGSSYSLDYVLISSTASPPPSLSFPKWITSFVPPGSGLLQEKERNKNDWKTFFTPRPRPPTPYSTVICSVVLRLRSTIDLFSQNRQ